MNRGSSLIALRMTAGGGSSWFAHRSTGGGSPVLVPGCSPVLVLVPGSSPVLVLVLGSSPVLLDPSCVADTAPVEPLEVEGSAPDVVATSPVVGVSCVVPGSSGVDPVEVPVGSVVPASTPV